MKIPSNRIITTDFRDGIENCLSTVFVRLKHVFDFSVPCGFLKRNPDFRDGILRAGLDTRNSIKTTEHALTKENLEKP